MKISKNKREKISEQILLFLYSKVPQALFTSNIASELARDEEFVKKLLLELKKGGLVSEIKKNAKGASYRRRSRWSLTDSVYRAYKVYQ